MSVHNTSAANSSGHERGESVGAEERSASADEREKELKDKEKQARVEASIREREKEVQRTLATHLRDRDKEREQHKHDEAVQHFNALLADLVSLIILLSLIENKCRHRRKLIFRIILITIL